MAHVLEPSSTGKHKNNPGRAAVTSLRKTKRVEVLKEQDKDKTWTVEVLKLLHEAETLGGWGCPMFCAALSAKHIWGKEDSPLIPTSSGNWEFQGSRSLVQLRHFVDWELGEPQECGESSAHRAGWEQKNCQGSISSKGFIILFLNNFFFFWLAGTQCLIKHCKKGSGVTSPPWDRFLLSLCSCGTARP